MKKAIGFCLLLFLAVNANAEKEAHDDVFTGYVKYDYDTKHTFDIEPEIYLFKYEEPDRMKEEGVFYGVNLNYMYSINPDTTDSNYPFRKSISTFFLGLETRFAVGSVDYDGNANGTADSIDNYAIEARGILGWDVQLAQAWICSPYIGFGYRYQNNDGAGVQTTTGSWRYERESEYFYFPIGADFCWDLSKTMQLGCVIEGDLFLAGTQTYHLEDIPNQGYDTTTNKQKNGYGVRASIYLCHEMKHVALSVEPFVRYWDIDDSDSPTDDSNTLEAGLQFGIHF